MSDFPKISIVTPSYNQVAFLDQTLRSVLDQGYPNLEYIVIDGGSNDGSTALIERVASGLHFNVSEPDSGQSHAINKGFSAANGDILGWINSDDYLEPGCLHRVSQLLGGQTGPAWVVGSARLVDERGRHFSVRTAGTIGATTFLRWTGEWFAQQATFWNRAMWERVGPVDEDLHFTMDLALWQRMYHVCTPLQVPDVLAAYRIHDSAKCVSDAGAARDEQRRLIRAWYAGQFGPDNAESLPEPGDLGANCARLDALIDDYVLLNEQFADAAARLARIRRHPVIGRFIRFWTRLVNPGFDA